MKKLKLLKQIIREALQVGGVRGLPARLTTSFLFHFVLRPLVRHMWKKGHSVRRFRTWKPGREHVELHGIIDEVNHVPSRLPVRAIYTVAFDDN